MKILSPKADGFAAVVAILALCGTLSVPAAAIPRHPAEPGEPAAGPALASPFEAPVTPLERDAPHPSWGPAPGNSESVPDGTPPAKPGHDAHGAHGAHGSGEEPR